MWNSRRTALLPRRWPICKTLSDARKKSFLACFSCLSSERQFGGLTVKISLILVRTKKMTNLQSTVTRSFVFTELSGAFYQTDIFKLLLENSCWTPLRRKRWPICKILSNAVEWSFSVSILLLIIRATFWSSYCEIGAKPHCGQKYGQFLKHCHRPFIHRYPLVYLYIWCKQHFGVLTVKFLLN